MTDTSIGRRYASAVFKLGAQEGNDVITKRGKVLQALDAMLAENAALENVFKSPIFTVAEKKKVLADLLAKLDCDAVTRNFCFLLADKERLPYYRAIARAYAELLDQAKNIIRGTITTAIPLSQAKQKSVKAELEAKANATLELSFDVDPAILGGIVLKMGNKVLDSSLRAQLEILRGTLKRGN